MGTVLCIIRYLHAHLPRSASGQGSSLDRPHDGRQRSLLDADRQMDVVVHQAVGVDATAEPCDRTFEEAEMLAPIGIDSSLACQVDREHHISFIGPSPSLPPEPSTETPIHLPGTILARGQLQERPIHFQRFRPAPSPGGGPVVAPWPPACTLDHPRPDGIQDDVARELEEMRLPLDENRLETPLEKMACPSVPPVEILRARSDPENLLRFARPSPHVPRSTGGA